MKAKRHAKILELIGNKHINTQEELQAELGKNGFLVTQATVSRDIKELRLLKRLNDEGRYVYTHNGEAENNGVSDKMSIILSKSIVNVDYALNTNVIKTLAGMAQGAASVLDAMHFPECLGSIAGDDTIFVTTRSEEAAQRLCKKLKNMTN